MSKTKPRQKIVLPLAGALARLLRHALVQEKGQLDLPMVIKPGRYDGLISGRTGRLAPPVYDNINRGLESALAEVGKTRGQGRADQRKRLEAEAPKAHQERERQPGKAAQGL